MNTNINEGIDINPRSKKISYNPNHEKNLVTGNYKFIPNPIYSKFKGFKVISLFERKKSDIVKNDASPIIYALKGEKGWIFSSEYDFRELFKCFIRIIRELQEKYDTICIVPSSNRLKYRAMSYIAKYVDAKYKISEFMYKMDADTVWEDCIDWEQIEYDFKNPDYAQKVLANCFNSMPNNIFRYHDINPVSYRKYIKNIFYIPNAEIIKNAKYFNGKKVLVIDDTIATGKSMADCCQTIIDTFDCKSITILTLFSRL